MKAGKLDRRITLQRKQLTASPSGQPIETWVDIAARRWASVAPVRGEERFSDPQIGARQQTEFQIRYSQDVAGLTPQDRVVYPAIDPDASPPDVPDDTRIYDVHAVHEIGRRDGLRIITVRRTDT